MRNPNPIFEPRPKYMCRWCRTQRDIFRGLCVSCDNKLKSKWKEYEEAMNTMIIREQALFDISFAAAYGMGQFHTVVFGQERLSLRNILESHMQKTAEYMSDLRAHRIHSITNSLHKRAVSLNSSSVPPYLESNQDHATSDTREVNPPELANNVSPRDQLRAQIIQHWPPEKDPRASMFVNERIHTETFLKLLLRLAPFYSWEDTTRMVNCMIIERIRHGENKQRCHIRDDFWNVFEICRELKFVPTHPELTTHEELEDVNCRIYKWGLLKDGYYHGPGAESRGVCAKQHAFCAQEEAPSAFVFTYQYRNRCRNAREGGDAGASDVFADEEEYARSASGSFKSAKSRFERKSASRHDEPPEKYRAYY